MVTGKVFGIVTKLDTKTEELQTILYPSVSLCFLAPFISERYVVITENIDSLPSFSSFD